MIMKKIGDHMYRNYNDKKISMVEKTLAFVQATIEKGEPWTDPDFKPCLDSLCCNGTPAQFEKCSQY